MSYQEAARYAMETFDFAVRQVFNLLRNAETRPQTEAELSEESLRIDSVPQRLFEALGNSARASPHHFARRVVEIVLDTHSHPLLRTAVASVVLRPCCSDYLRDGDVQEITSALARVIADPCAASRLHLTAVRGLAAMTGRGMSGAWPTYLRGAAVAAAFTAARHDDEQVAKRGYELLEQLAQFSSPIGKQANDLLAKLARRKP